MRKHCLLMIALLVAFASVSAERARAQAASAPSAAPKPSAQGSPTKTQSAPPSDASAQSGQPQRITAYTLPPDREQKARALSKVRLRLLLLNFVYGLVVLWVVLRWRLSAKYRDVAEKTSARRFLQVMVFSPLLILTIDALSLPTGVYENWVQRAYGLSVQGWGSWFWDWSKGELINIIVFTLLIWILYGAIRKSPRRWWFYFWLASLPIGLLLFFLQPLIIDPMFHKFEPLQRKDPALTDALEKMVQRGGQDIPRERMFWMGAGEKTTALNAYVTGFGASKRIVVWDTTIAKMNTPQIVFVAGHEMGHYVLGHVPKLLSFLAGLFFVAFYLCYRLSGSVLSRWGPGWGLRGLEDWASLPALLIIFQVVIAVTLPVANNFIRYQEHQADQYALEVTHGLTPDSGQVGAQAFNILGNVNLSDPEPSRLRIFLLYDHPAVPDRVQFSLSYDPWSKGQQPEFVK